MDERNQKIPNYSYGYAESLNNELKQYEISTEIPTTVPDKSIIVRLDGKGMTKRFKSEDNLFLPEFHYAMKSVLENIRNYCPYVKFAYSFKDEISLLLNKNEVQNSKDFQNRIEKVLPILSGYISAMFSQYLTKKLKKKSNESFTFDARIIILPTVELKKYFHLRQAFAMSGFIDAICKYKKLKPYSKTFLNVKNALIEIGDSWYNYPQYVSRGYVGYFENNKWTVKTASDFMQKWYKYESCLDE